MDREKLYSYFDGVPLLFGYQLCPNWFRGSNIPNFHKEIIDAATTYDKLAVAAPRGHSKSTILCFLYVLYCIIFRKKKYIIIIGNTEKKAADHLTAIKSELASNVELQKFIGEMTFLKENETDTVFQSSWGVNTRVLCKGVNQIGSLRGTKHINYRPDLIIMDDIEDDEMVKNPERREQLKSDFDNVIMQIGDVGTQFIAIGTVLHDDSQIAKLVGNQHYPTWEKLFYRALDETTMTALWPEKRDVAWLLDLKREDPLAYAKEFQNDPIAGTNTRFKKNDFRYWIEDGKYYVTKDGNGNTIAKGLLSDCRGAVAGDLAWSEKKEADNCVLLSGLLTPDNEILVYRYYAERGMRPDRLCNLLFELVERIEKITCDSCPVGFEKAMLERVTQWILKQEMRKRNKWIITKELKWDTDKIKRISLQLENRYANNAVYHKAGMGELEHELLRFPYGVHDDIIDALQSVCQLLKIPKGVKNTKSNDDMFEWLVKNGLKSKEKKEKNLGNFFLGKQISRQKSQILTNIK